MTADVQVLDQGTIVVFTPVSEDAKGWFAEYVGPPNWAGGYACDRRPARTIADALACEGFSFEAAAYH